MRSVVLIPVYNEEKYIETLIYKTKKFIEDVVVVDDGSADESAALAKKAGAFVLSYKANRGKGAAIRSGLDYIAGKDFEAVIIMDSDGQHRPEEIRNFISSYEASGAPVIVGNRMENAANMPRIRNMTNKVMSKMVSFICGQEIPDTQCGFRFIAKKVLRQIKLTSSNYEIESELLIRASRAGFKIDSIPVTAVYSKEISYINPFIDTLRFIRLLISISLKR